ncbi:MAG: type II toxin-antitoxin system RelE/ParE family toxin [Cyclobacteriaceae bacterium]
MTGYSIRILRSAQKSLSQLPRKDYLRVKKKLLSLPTNPFPVGSKKLKGRDGFRLRVGKYRVIYLVRKNELLILILDIDHRKDIYK